MFCGWLLAGIKGKVDQEDWEWMIHKENLRTQKSEISLKQWRNTLSSIEETQTDGRKWEVIWFSCLGVFAKEISEKTQRGKNKQQEIVCGWEVEALDVDVSMTCCAGLFSMDSFISANIWWAPTVSQGKREASGYCLWETCGLLGEKGQVHK